MEQDVDHYTVRNTLPALHIKARQVAEFLFLDTCCCELLSGQLLRRVSHYGAKFLNVESEIQR